MEVALHCNRLQCILLHCFHCLHCLYTAQTLQNGIYTFIFCILARALQKYRHSVYYNSKGSCISQVLSVYYNYNLQRNHLLCKIRLFLAECKSFLDPEQAFGNKQPNLMSVVPLAIICCKFFCHCLIFAALRSSFDL